MNPVDGGDDVQLDAAELFNYRQLIRSLPDMSVLSFDLNLRLQVAVGELLDRNGYQGDALTGRLIRDVLPATAMSLLEGSYRSALAGRASDFDYSSPINGRRYRMRVRPLLDGKNEVVGGLVLTEDVTDDRARRDQLEQLHLLSNVGGAWYDADSGWRFDDELKHLVGVDTDEQVLTAMDELVIAEDRAGVKETLIRVMTGGGRCTVRFRLRHGKTGDLRNLDGTCEAVVDESGKLMRAVMTHTDVTDAVIARQDARELSARARTMLLRQVSDSLVTNPGPLTETLQRITDIAAAAAGDGAVMRVLTSDGLAVELDLVSHSDVAARTRIAEFLRAEAEHFDPAAGLHGAVNARGELVSSIGDVNWRQDPERQIDPSSIGADFEHFVLAPIRHEGAVLGYLHVFRADAGLPYEPGDDDLVQLLADRVGAMVAENRVQQIVERQLAAAGAVRERLAELSVEQHDLLGYLAAVEERERTLLAVAIHDDPMQLIIATIMRMDILRARVDENAGRELDQLAAMFATSVDQLRKLIVALTPPDLTAGLGPALKNLAEGIFMGTTVRMTFQGPAHVGLIPSTKVTAYRIMREALVNARKHADARNIILSLEQTPDTVTVELTDDGVGSATLHAGPGHLGLTTMRVRASSENGQLNIASGVGSGTTVTLTLPRPWAANPARREDSNNS